MLLLIKLQEFLLTEDICLIQFTQWMQLIKEKLFNFFFLFNTLSLIYWMTFKSCCKDAIANSPLSFTVVPITIVSECFMCIN